MFRMKTHHATSLQSLQKRLSAVWLGPRRKNLPRLLSYEYIHTNTNTFIFTGQHLCCRTAGCQESRGRESVLFGTSINFTCFAPIGAFILCCATSLHATFCFGPSLLHYINAGHSLQLMQYNATRIAYNATHLPQCNSINKLNTTQCKNFLISEHTHISGLFDNNLLKSTAFSL